MERYEFTITIAGNSETGNLDEVWIDACQSFALDYGNKPENYKCEKIEE